MKPALSLQIDVRKIIENHEDYRLFSFVNENTAEQFANGLNLSYDELDCSSFDHFGDLDQFFELKIKENPVRWAVVWGCGYSTQFSLYADTYDEKCVDVFASLGIAVLLFRCRRDERTRCAANLILKARSNAIGLLRTQPERIGPNYEGSASKLDAFRHSLEAEIAALEAQAKVLKESIPEKLEAKRQELYYTKEQRKANKARASAIRLRARTMSFVDKRSVR